MRVNPDQPGVNFTRSQHKPIRVVTEMREVRKYPHLEGFIVEKWFPASAYGSQLEWYAYKAADGVTPLMGPYPERGDYEMQFGPWSHTPSTDSLQRLISQYSHQINSRTGTPESRAQEYLLRYQYNEELAERKRKEEYNAEFRDLLSPMKSGSLAASRWRQELATRIGVTDAHVPIQ